MRYVKSNSQQTEWYVMWTRKGQDIVVSRHGSQAEAVAACWPKY